MNSNSENPKVGRDFELLAKKLLSKHYKVDFDDKDKAIVPIGNPSKPHKFDLVSVDKKIVVECKSLTWTVGKNTPAAKLATLNQSLLYASFLPKNTTKVIVMKESKHPNPKRNETLAGYYYKSYKHLFRDTVLLEITDSDEIRTF